MIKLNCPKCLEPLAFADERRGDDVRCQLPDAPPPARQAAGGGDSSPPPQPSKPVKPKPPPPDDGVVEGVEATRRPRRVRKKRRRSPAGGSFALPEWLLPLGLFACAAVTNVLLALRGGDNGKGLLVFSLIDLAVTVPTTAPEG
ncbi:MAG TPA: hypothetical protein VH120_14960 [Gemmataceae bacterium]|nr:hypothetical protein [Gemmataceae bacterium]